MEFLKRHCVAIVAALLFALAIFTAITVDKCKARDLNMQQGRISALVDGCEVKKNDN